MFQKIYISLFQTLYIQDNKLKQLPNSIGSLKNLQTLNISGNSLKEIPLSISGLVSLKTLDLRNNPKLKRIPKDVAQLRGLDTLLLDEKHINYPDQEIVSQGTEAIMRFLCSGWYCLTLLTNASITLIVMNVFMWQMEI